MKKKFLVLIVSLLMLFAAGTTSVFAEGDASAQLVPDFSDDFESYEAGKWIEETSGFSDKWSNNVLNEDEGLQVDSHLKERAKIVYEEGNPDNKVLYLSNMTGGNSFFYIGPQGDYRYKNFIGSFRVKFLEGNDGWVSLNVRKSDNVWYTGCHNVNITLAVEKDKSCIVAHAYRNMPGSVDQLLKEDNNEGYTISYQTYTSDTKQYEGDWFDVRYEVQDSSFKLYVDDTLLVDMNYPSRMVSGFGYVSLNGCTTMAYFDDVYIENLDTEAPPALEEPEEPAEPSGPADPGSGNEEEETPPENDAGGGSGCNGSIAAGMALSPLLIAGAAVICRRKRR